MRSIDEFRLIMLLIQVVNNVVVVVLEACYDTCSLEHFSFHKGQQMSDFFSVGEFYLFLYKSFEGSPKISPVKNVR